MKKIAKELEKSGAESGSLNKMNQIFPEFPRDIRKLLWNSYLNELDPGISAKHPTEIR